LKGGGEVGSRVLGAASACVVAAGLFLCGLGGALALAEPPAIPGGTHSNDGPGKGPKDESDGSDGAGASNGEKPDTGDNTETDDPKPGSGENPNNGNCGNDGSNGNAQHCGGGTATSPPGTSTTNSTTHTTTNTTPPTTTESTSTTESSTTSSKTTSSETTTSTSTSTSSVGLPPPAGGGGGGGAVEAPSGIPELPPEMQLPPELTPPATEPSVIDVVPGLGAAAVELPIPPITLPVIVAPMGVGGAGAAPGAPALPVTPRGVSAEPPAGREPLPANVGSNVTVPASSYRIGYTDYLRSAGLSQVAALAVPGVAGMLVLTGAGGLVGYRQAKAGHAVHTNGTARFVN
jgi:hypothetical protein